MQFNDAVLLARDTLCNLQLLSINRGLIGGTKVGQEGFNVIWVANVEAASLEILGDLAPCPTLTYDCCHSLFFPANREIRGRATAQTLRIGSASPAERLSTSRTDGCAPSQRRALPCACDYRLSHPRFIARTRPGPCAAAKRRPAANVK